MKLRSGRHDGVKFEFPYPSGGCAVKSLVAKFSFSLSLPPCLFLSPFFPLAIGQQADQLIPTGSKIEKIFRE